MVRFRENVEHLFLQRDGDFARFAVFLFAGRLEMKAIGAAIFLVGFAGEETGGFHPFEQGSDGVGVAAHERGEFTLSNAVVLQQSAHDGKLIGRYFQMGSAAAKGLVEAVPGAAKQGRQALAFGGVNGKLILSCGGGHFD